MDNHQLFTLGIIQAAMIRAMGMQAANQAAILRNETPPYGEHAFSVEAFQMEQLVRNQLG